VFLVVVSCVVRVCSALSSKTEMAMSIVESTGVGLSRGEVDDDDAIIRSGEDEEEEWVFIGK